MTKFTKILVLSCVVLVAGTYWYKAKQSKQLERDGDMALLYLVELQGWASMPDQLAAVNRGTIETKSRPTSLVDGMVLSHGWVTISDRGICKEVVYSWPLDNREQPILHHAVDCPIE